MAFIPVERMRLYPVRSAGGSVRLHLNESDANREVERYGGQLLPPVTRLARIGPVGLGVYDDDEFDGKPGIYA